MRTILLLAANPKGTDRLRLDEEVRRVEEGLQRARNRDQFRRVVKWAVTDTDLRRALLDTEPEIVHFSGHGTRGTGQPGGRGLRPADDDDPGGLAFEADNGEARPISAGALSRLFELYTDRVRCVVLNACYSGPQAEAIAQHVDYVVGMSRAIGDVAAIHFAVGFYDAIGAGKDYTFVFRLGCCSIDLRGIPEQLTPVLKRRPVAVAPQAAPPARAAAPAPGAAPAPPRRERPARAGVPPEVLSRAAEELACHIGPVAHFLAERAAADARSVRDLYRALAVEIPSGEKRQEFLDSMPR